MSDSRIVFTNFDSPLGEMIAGATAKGVCFLEWHDRGGIPRIMKRVEKRYKTQPTDDENNNPHLLHLRSELTEYFAGERRSFSVPIDVTGTPFELSVWKHLLMIPCGETRSYGQIAAALGKPGGMRAVGRANGANYLAIVIPCHRVIQTGGGLGGYGGKIWRKKHLLDLEMGNMEIDLENRSIHKSD